MLKDVIIKTDGSCLNNGQQDARGGCAICVYDKDTGKMIYRRIFKPHIERMTNNRCEMYAFNDALQFIAKHENIRALLQSDSTAVVDGILGIAQRRANRDLWESIEATIPLIHDRIIGVEHIDGNTENTDADHLAFQAANSLFINEHGEWFVEQYNYTKRTHQF
jgi:ribonuclease HI